MEVSTAITALVAPDAHAAMVRPLLPDGTLGEEKLFRGGVDLKSGFEKAVRLDKGRVLTAAGLNCMFNDVNGIRGSSARLSLASVSP